MSDDQLEAVRDFIHYITETGQLSGEDNDFVKAMYYDFREHKDTILFLTTKQGI